MKTELSPLEELKELKNVFVGHCIELNLKEDYIRVCENKFDKIETTLKENEQARVHELKVRDIDKKLKALEIIKEKRADTITLVSYIKEQPDDEWALATYNQLCMERSDCVYYKGREWWVSLELSREEYGLLKEMLL